MSDKIYEIKIIEKGTPYLWNTIEAAALSHIGWNTTYTPEAWAKCVFEDGTGLHIKLSCREKDPLARYTKFFDPVYKDSCLEFFSSYDGENYMNIELNSNGAMLCAFGDGRNNRTPIDEIIGLYNESSAFPIVTGTEESGDVWFAELTIPVDAMKKIYKISEEDIKPGFILKGNFYKCGDETESEHYMMWSPVLTEAPDYHRPEHFGTLIFK